MKKQISFVAKRMKLIPFITNRSFEFRRDKGFIYIQKLCLWFLAKIKAYHTDYYETVETFTIDAESFKNHYVIFTYYYSERGRPKILDLEIYVIPWMEGILLVKE